VFDPLKYYMACRDAAVEKATGGRRGREARVCIF